MSSLLRFRLYVLLLVTAAACANAEPRKDDLVLYRHAPRYSAFPSLYKNPASDALWVSFGWNTSRSHYGKAAGGETGSVSLYSPDGGKTWLQKGEDSAYKDVPSQTTNNALSDGTLINIGAVMHEVLPAEKKDEMVKRGILVKEWPGGHISASYRVRMWRQRPFDHAQGRPELVEGRPAVLLLD